MNRRCLGLSAALLLSAGCSPADPPPLRVLAAASMTEVVDQVALGFAEPVATSFGSSSVLARQILDGAPADVFVSASRDWIEALREADALDVEALVIARNRLVAIAPRSDRLRGSVTDATQLFRQLGDDARVAIADPGVPAGEYSRSALAAVGVLPEATGRLVGLSDVRAVLRAVERADVDAGFVYATDARIADVETLFVFPPETHPPIETLAAVVRGARRPDEARRFLNELAGPAGRRALVDAGFELP